MREGIRSAQTYEASSLKVKRLGSFNLVNRATPATTKSIPPPATWFLKGGANLSSFDALWTTKSAASISNDSWADIKIKDHVVH